MGEVTYPGRIQHTSGIFSTSLCSLCCYSHCIQCLPEGTVLLGREDSDTGHIGKAPLPYTGERVCSGAWCVGMVPGAGWGGCEEWEGERAGETQII